MRDLVITYGRGISVDESAAIMFSDLCPIMYTFNRIGAPWKISIDFSAKKIWYFSLEKRGQWSIILYNEGNLQTIIECHWFWCLFVELLPSQCIFEGKRIKKLLCKWFLWGLLHRSQTAYPFHGGVLVIFYNKYHPISSPGLVSWGFLLSHWVRYFIRNRLDITIICIGLCTELIKKFRRVTFSVMRIYSSPSSGTYVFLEFLINGLSMEKYVVYGLSVMILNHHLTAYCCVNLKLPCLRAINNWWTLLSFSTLSKPT